MWTFFESWTKSACLVAAKAAESPWGDHLSKGKQFMEYDDYDVDNLIIIYSWIFFSEIMDYSKQDSLKNLHTLASSSSRTQGLTTGESYTRWNFSLQSETMVWKFTSSDVPELKRLIINNIITYQYTWRPNLGWIHGEKAATDEFSSSKPDSPVDFKTNTEKFLLSYS